MVEVLGIEGNRDAANNKSICRTNGMQPTALRAAADAGRQRLNHA
jgi:hypothetical protein